MKKNILFTFLLLLFTFFSIGTFGMLWKAEAQAPSASVQLSRHHVSAGEMVQMNITVEGAENAHFPSHINIPGVEAQFNGESAAFNSSLNQFVGPGGQSRVDQKASYTVTASYILIPLDTGRFVIPSISFSADGQDVKTQPVTLEVDGIAGPNYAGKGPRGRPLNAPLHSSLSRGGGSSGQNPNSIGNQEKSPADQPPKHLAYAEVELAKKDLYQGESLPMKLIFYCDTQYHVTPLQFISQLQGEGLSVSIHDDTPEVHPVERHGVIYQKVTFEGTLSALKSGKRELSSAVMAMAADDPNFVHSFDDGLLDDFIARSGIPVMGRQREIEVKTDPITLNVKPFPEEGKPESFHGAVGEFQLSGEVSPKKATVGDVVTLTTTISGKGNFNTMQAPEYGNTQDWKTYPPAEHFEADNNLNNEGSKSFEMTMIAKNCTQKTPSATFSYFNPNTERYVTLEEAPQEIDITPSTNPDATSSPSPAPTGVAPTNSAQPQEKQGIEKTLEETNFIPWADPLHRAELLWAWLALWGATLVLALYFLGKRASRIWHSEEKKRLAHLKDLWDNLHHENIGPDMFYHDAVEYLALRYQMGKKDLSSNTQEELLALLKSFTQKRDELAYGARASNWSQALYRRYQEELTPFSP